jgi:hypothetical protein
LQRFFGGKLYCCPACRSNFFVSVGINDDGGSQLSFRTNALGVVPEPGSLVMVVIGLGSLAALARRKRTDRQNRLRKR